MVADPDYREGLSAEELVGTLQSLLAAERKTMRLTCRYLADLADAMEPAARGLEPAVETMAPAAGGLEPAARRLVGRDGAGGALAAYADVVHAAECLFGLGAHSTRERIRVGRALRALPKIEGALVSGELSYSRAREVTRVATPADESTWLDLASTLPMRTLERRVVEATGNGSGTGTGTGTGTDTGTGTGKGSPLHTGGPAQLRWSSPENVQVTLRLPAEVWALVKRAMEGARRASESPLSEAEALSAVARDALDRQNTGADTSDLRHTVVLYECQSCARLEVDTGAGPLELGAGPAATLGCGARVRDLRTEGRVVRRGGPLPKAIDRAVRLRDRHTCRVPGCHRRRYVDVHHLRFQSEGGEHSRSNCVCLCTKHHALLHEGHLRIEGEAEGELLFYGATGAPLSAAGASRGGTTAAPGAENGATGAPLSAAGASPSGTTAAPGAENGATGAPLSAAGASRGGTTAAPGAENGATGAPLSAAGASPSGPAAAAFASPGAMVAARGASPQGTVAAPGASQGGTAAAAFASPGAMVGATGASPRGTVGAAGASRGGTAAAGFGAHGAMVRAMGLGREAAMLLALMGGRGGWSLDALVDASGLRVGVVQGALMGLELDGCVSFDALGNYAMSTAA